MHGCIESPYNSALFSNLDDSSVHWQLGIEDSDILKTPLTSYQGLYCFLRISIVLQYTTSTIQPSMAMILSRFKYQFALYPENIVIFARTLERYNYNFRKVLLLLS